MVLIKFSLKIDVISVASDLIPRGSEFEVALEDFSYSLYRSEKSNQMYPSTEDGGKIRLSFQILNESEVVDTVYCFSDDIYFENRDYDLMRIILFEKDLLLSEDLFPFESVLEPGRNLIGLSFLFTHEDHNYVLIISQYTPGRVHMLIFQKEA